MEVKADTGSAIRFYPDFTDTSKQADVGDASCPYQEKYAMEFKRKAIQPVRAVLSQQARFACILQELHYESEPSVAILARLMHQQGVGGIPQH